MAACRCAYHNTELEFGKWVKNPPHEIRDLRGGAILGGSKKVTIQGFSGSP
jgi:hypothetical protein